MKRVILISVVYFFAGILNLSAQEMKSLLEFGKTGTLAEIVDRTAFSAKPQATISVVINEVVTDPQQDWNDSAGGNGVPFDNQPGNGTITPTDEWVELYNNGTESVNLLSAGGWQLLLVDTTPDTLHFADVGSGVEFVFSNGGSLSNFQPGEYLVVGNPPGNLNNDIYLALENDLGVLVDDVELGDDPEGDGNGDGAPDGGVGGGNATGIDDEAIARVPDGADTNDDVADFAQQAATIGASNDGLTCMTYHFPVVDGAWYLISLPVIPENSSVSTLFPNAASAFAWDFQTSNYVQVDTLEPGGAYWLLMLQTDTVEVCGQPFESDVLNYSQVGWDMIGAADDTCDLVDAPPGCIISMFGWDAVAQSYTQIDPFITEPAQGYWVLVFEVPCMLSIECNAGSGASALKHAATTGPPISDLAAFYELHGKLPPLPPSSSAISNQQSEISLPAELGLSQNYPNPFNPETVIEYQLPEASHVNVKIYSVLGQEIRTLVDGEFPAGAHRVSWDGRDNAGQRMESGTYFVRLQAGEFVQTRKLLLVK